MPTLFHGSVTDGIETFHPFSHFGDLGQALAIVSKKLEDLYEGDFESTGFVLPPAPTVYEVEIDPAALAKPLHVADWGTPMVIGIAVAARDAFDADGPNPCKGSYQAFEGIRASLAAEKSGWVGKTDHGKAVANRALQRRGWQLLQAELQSRGWTCLAYDNIVEGETAAPSICIPDPRHVRCVGKRTPSAFELAGAKLQSSPLKPV